jgi:hypothetical protein
MEGPLPQSRFLPPVGYQGIATRPWSTPEDVPWRVTPSHRCKLEPGPGGGVKHAD